MHLPLVIRESDFALTRLTIGVTDTAIAESTEEMDWYPVYRELSKIAAGASYLVDDTVGAVYRQRLVAFGQAGPVCDADIETRDRVTQAARRLGTENLRPTWEKAESVPGQGDRIIAAQNPKYLFARVVEGRLEVIDVGLLPGISGAECGVHD